MEDYVVDNDQILENRLEDPVSMNYYVMISS